LLSINPRLQQGLTFQINKQIQFTQDSSGPRSCFTNTKSVELVLVANKD